MIESLHSNISQCHGDFLLRSDLEKALNFSFYFILQYILTRKSKYFGRHLEKLVHLEREKIKEKEEIVPRAVLCSLKWCDPTASLKFPFTQILSTNSQTIIAFPPF